MWRKCSPSVRALTLKARDVFDLHWLVSHGVAGVYTPQSLHVRLATNPDESVGAWLVKARARRAELASSAGPIEADLRRWLPSSWPLTGAAVQSRVQSAISAVDEGLRAMRQLVAPSRAEPAGPSS